MRQYINQQTTYNSEPNIIPSMDVRTRWNSTHIMCRDALKIKKSLTKASEHLVSQNVSEYSSIEEEDWEMAIILTDFLEPFNQGNKKIILT